MHAGFWLNHTVHDPYPDKLDTIMKQMVNDYVLYPLQIYIELLEFEGVLHQMAKDKKQFEDSGDRARLNKAIDGLDAIEANLKSKQ